MAIARIGPTGYGTYGILWAEFPYMEARGGYSGPFDTQDAAQKRANEVAAAFDQPLTVQLVETVNP